jgi:uncharacterized membrane protein
MFDNVTHSTFHAGDSSAGPTGTADNRRAFLRLSLFCFIATAGCLLLLLFRIVLTGSLFYSFLAWNLLLAWVPYILAVAIVWLEHRLLSIRRLRAAIIVVGILWLLFYPNAPYILTDFAYIFHFPFRRRIVGGLVGPTALLWYDIVLNASFSFLGHLLGLISLVFVHRTVSSVFSPLFGWAAVCASVLVGGYGIYLGRFVRLNSWNVFTRPLSTLSAVVRSILDMKALLFTLCFSFFILLTYLVVYAFHGLCVRRREGERVQGRRADRDRD